ncbi:MAG: hypothetical protein EOP45_14355 [Sphingobacteriaceae bacterium]|nr:MAG: hypothetical protein EOP45_14355 [Sphingobacteriaceae bacterium]
MIDFETNLYEFFDQQISQFVLEKIDEVELRGSGFKLKEIRELNIQISRYEPFGGSSYIKLPKNLEKKHAIINVKNKDQQCFKYAVLSAMFPAADHACRVSNYKQYENELDFSGITFPVEVRDITKFEAQNPSISINVYMPNRSGKSVHPLRLTKTVKRNHIHLLLLMKMKKSNGDDEIDNSDDEDVDMSSNLIGTHENKMHYCWIKKMSALLGKQMSAHGHKQFFCDRCLNCFSHIQKLEAHRVDCFRKNEYEIEMPLPGVTISFENHRKQMRVPFIVYADVESLLKKPEIQFCQTETTTAYQQHEVYSIGYYHTSTLSARSVYRSKRGPDCIEWFVQEMINLAKEAESLLEQVEPMELTLEEQVLHGWAEECHICERPFAEGEIKVRDHSHLTGHYRGAAHNACNLNYKEPRHIPVIFHNLTNYDAHFIIKALAKTPGSIQVIPQNEERYISFTKTVPSSNKYSNSVRLRFIDSFQFMASSLDYTIRQI